ncbi:hypothetical protein L2U69_05845 [Zavarzinia compransoris]|uniref:hypothetical protein n=1 Tax=Zavarzinia marina TaxID=2911065 RepID=UPI001F3239F0|nr:hypothetical protein [Zavarzinia marina]MCF4165158.1 hypothetical protein [Zavarzinia marina]
MMKEFRGCIPALAVVAALACLSGPRPAGAGNCDCRPEIGNADAVTTDLCAKVWKEGQCTLKESGANSTYMGFLGQWPGIDGSSVAGDPVDMSRYAGLGGKIPQIAEITRDIDFLTEDDVVAQFDRIGRQADPAVMEKLWAGREVIPRDLFNWRVADAMIADFGAPEIGFALRFANEHTVNESLFREEVVENRDVGDGRIARFGDGCFQFGRSDAYVLVDFLPAGVRCPAAFFEKF